MKKILFYLPLCTLIAVVLFQCSVFCINNVKNHENPIDEKEQYCRKINEIIRDLEFHSAEAKDEKIILYDKDRNPTSEIPFAEYDESQKLIYARKSGDIVYFTTGGSVDDEWGIMFVNDGSDSMMDTIWRADRMGGNAYEYNTPK